MACCTSRGTSPSKLPSRTCSSRPPAPSSAHRDKQTTPPPTPCWTAWQPIGVLRTWLGKIKTLFERVFSMSFLWSLEGNHRLSYESLTPKACISGESCHGLGARRHLAQRALGAVGPMGRSGHGSTSEHLRAGEVHGRGRGDERAGLGDHEQHLGELSAAAGCRASALGQVSQAPRPLCGVL